MLRLPQDIIQQHIEPFSRSPQSKDLCKDIRDYSTSLQIIFEIIRDSIIEKYTSHFFDVKCTHLFNKMTWVILKNVLKYYDDNIVHFRKIKNNRDMKLFYRGYDDYTMNSINTINSKNTTDEYMKITRVITRVLWGSMDTTLRKLFIVFMKKKIHVL